MVVIPASFYLFELERKESKYRSAGQMVGSTLSGRGLRADWEDPNFVAVVDYEVHIQQGYNTNT